MNFTAEYQSLQASGVGEMPLLLSVKQVNTIPELP